MKNKVTFWLFLITALYIVACGGEEDGSKEAGSEGPVATGSDPSSDADWDPCKSTIVTDDNQIMTAKDICDMIQDNCSGTTLIYETQCYPGVLACCAKHRVTVAGGAGGQPNETQNYNTYDVAVAGEIGPGKTVGEVHDAGVANRGRAKPQAYGDQSTVQEDDACVISYAGLPEPPDKGYADTISGNNPGTTILEGDGSRQGTESATPGQLEGALSSCGDRQCVLYITDHGNQGTNVVTCEQGTCSGVVRISEELIKEAISQGDDDNSVLVIESSDHLPESTSISFNDYRVSVDVEEYRIGESGQFRAHFPLGNELLRTSNRVSVDVGEREALVEIWWDTGPVAKSMSVTDRDEVPRDQETPQER